LAEIDPLQNPTTEHELKAVASVYDVHQSTAQNLSKSFPKLHAARVQWAKTMSSACFSFFRNVNVEYVPADADESNLTVRTAHDPKLTCV
jgi:hypothetical protein